MSDKTITELDALTVSASTDSLVVYDASATGTLKLTVANLLNKIPTWLGFSQTAETRTSAGAVDITSAITWVVTDDANALTLANGTEGQIKFIIMKTDGGAGTLTPSSTPANYSTIQFNDVGDSVQLLYTNAAWHIMGYHGVTIG
jgi:hypothetical protein